MSGPVPDHAAEFARIAGALHAVQAVPDDDAWNREELEGLLSPDTALVPAAVLVGLVARGEQLHVVFTLRNDELRHHAGQVSFPGGRIEPEDDGPAAAALREAHEEITLPPSKVVALGWLDPLATITGFRVLPLVARIAPDVVPVADPREVAAVFEVPLAYLLEPANLAQVAIEYRGGVRQVLEYIPHEGGARIWGVTASILRNFMDRLAAVAAP